MSSVLIFIGGHALHVYGPYMHPYDLDLRNHKHGTGANPHARPLGPADPAAAAAAGGTEEAPGSSGPPEEAGQRAQGEPDSNGWDVYDEHTRGGGASPSGAGTELGERSKVLAFSHEVVDRASLHASPGMPADQRMEFAVKFLSGPYSRRDQFPALLNALGLNGHGAELGVYDGKFAQAMVVQGEEGRPGDRAGKPKNPWKVDKYHLIEPALRPRLQEKLKVWKEDPDLKVRHVKDFSYNAHKKFPDGYFDFVYVDAGHTYAEVKQDLEDWYPKVKKGGLFAGHDYCSARSQKRSKMKRGKAIHRATDFSATPWCGYRMRGDPSKGEKLGWDGTVMAADEFAAKHGKKMHWTLEGRDPGNPYNTAGTRNPSWYFFA